MKSLKDYGYSGKHIVALFRFIDWVLRLPKELEPQFYRILKHMDQEQEMTRYVTSIERVVLKQGIQQGMQSGQADMLVRQLQRKFPAVPDSMIDRVKQANPDQLDTWSLNFVDATSLDEVFNSPN